MHHQQKIHQHVLSVSKTKKNEREKMRNRRCGGREEKRKKMEGKEGGGRRDDS